MKPFPSYRTRRDFFYTGIDGEQHEVDMMTNNLVNFNYTHTEDDDDLGRIQVVELPYAGELLQSRDFYQLQTKLLKALADLGGGVRDARPPLGVQILSISCSFRENLACSRPPWRVHAPPSGKSWIRHWKGNVFTGICLFTGGGGVGTSHVLWDRSHHRVLPPSDIRPGDYPPSSHEHQTWEPTPLHLVVITEDLFKLVHLRTYPSLTGTDI